LASGFAISPFAKLIKIALAHEIERVWDTRVADAALEAK
jgi:hypothetical protein